MRWDGIMVPGAGFPDETIEKLAVFREAKFGVRVQHVLNDQVGREGFQKVNQYFAPHVVIFNNLHWPVGSFTSFEADRFHVLLGGVDLQAFRPSTYRTHPPATGKWIVGGLANKNPWPLIDALADLPAEVVLRLYGPDTDPLVGKYGELIDSGRLELTGPLHGEDLCRFYREVDIVVMTEAYAGWANLVAEAMASGVPVACTAHGTGAFARHEETALVMRTPEPPTIAAAIRRLMRDSALCRYLTERAREAISAYSWESYAQQLLRLVQGVHSDGHRHYFHAPELGLHGKWSLDDRVRGLRPLLDQSQGLSVIDFGSAEGLVAREFLKRGAARVHGFELDSHRVNIANDLCRPWQRARFLAVDLRDWEAFEQAHADLIDETYDVALYLGIHHHLPPGHRLKMLRRVATRARSYLAIRTTAAVYETDAIDALLKTEGLVILDHGTQEPQPNQLGALKIYQRLGLQGNDGP